MDVGNNKVARFEADLAQLEKHINGTGTEGDTTLRFFSGCQISSSEVHQR